MPFDVDQIRSQDEMHVEPRGKDLVWMLDVPGHGILWIRTTSDANDDDPTGRESNEGMAAMTDAQLQRWSD